MNEVMSAIFTRRSIRAFEDRDIPKEELEQIAKAACYAPSGRNQQTWKFTVISEREKIQKLASVIAKELGREGYDMYEPAALIIPSNQKESPYGKEDNACALENIFLAAHSLGIGSVWINQLQGICDIPSIRHILKEFHIPEDHVVYGMAALGYAKEAAQKWIEKKGIIEFL